ncbi:MAG: tetratricopeptide repeat protein [Balneola sp.]
MSYKILLTTLSCFLFLTSNVSSQKKVLYEEVQALIDNSEFNDAKKTLEKNLKTYPDDAELHFLYGYTLIQMVGEISIFKKISYAKKGRDQYIKAIELDPKLIKAHKELSDYYLYSPGIVGGNTNKALQVIEGIKPHDPFKYLIYKGDFYSERENYEEANKIFLSAIEQYPDSLAPLAKTGLSYRRLEEYQKSADYFRKAIDMDSTYYLGYFHLGLAGLLGEFDLDKSISFFEIYIEQAVAGDQRYLDHANYRIGMIYELKNNVELAKTYYQRSLAVNPEFERAKEALEKL